MEALGFPVLESILDATVRDQPEERRQYVENLR